MTNLRVKNGFSEGQSTSSPPYFDGINYTGWKARMKIYLQSVDYQLWLNVSNGPYIPIKMVNNIEVPKLEEEFDDIEVPKLEEEFE